MRGARRPKEQAHAELVSEWIARLAPGASEALQLAARAHHLRRWAIPRADYPEGRAGYLRWRARAARLTTPRSAGDDPRRRTATTPRPIARVPDLLHKRGLARGDAEAQALEDALCLVFLETQYRELAERLARRSCSTSPRRRCAR